MVHPGISILCLIGLPASGKTHLASVIAKHKLGFTKVLLFCYDELIRWETEKFVWKEERNVVLKKVGNEISLFINTKEEQRMLIVLDDNMYYRSMRYPFYKLARSHKIKYCQVFVDSSLTICLARNSDRDSPLLTHHILNINEKLEVPVYNNSWEKNTLTVSGIGNVYEYLDKIKFFIESADVAMELKQKVMPMETHNCKHIADIALRRIISILVKQIKESKENNVAYKISKLIRKKNEIMKLINEDKVDLPSHKDIEIYILHLFPIMSE